MKKVSNNRFRLEHWHVIAAILVIYDVIAVNAAYFLALWFRFDCTFSALPGVYINGFVRFAPLYIDEQQYGSIHGLNENIYQGALPMCVDFYKAMIQRS